MINQTNIDSNQIQIDLNQIQIDPNHQVDNQSSQIYEEINDHAYITLPSSATNSSTNNYTHLNFNKSNKQKSNENKSKNIFTRLFEYIKSSKKRLALFVITCLLVGILLILTLVLIILGVASNLKKI
jgi:hypothetical protein